jgi:hypothetical protein
LNLRGSCAQCTVQLDLNKTVRDTQKHHKMNRMMESDKDSSQTFDATQQFFATLNAERTGSEEVSDQDHKCHTSSRQQQNLFRKQNANANEVMRNIACLLAIGSATGFLSPSFPSVARGMPHGRRRLETLLRSTEVSEMTARELKAELASLGASTAGLFDKESLAAALAKARTRSNTSSGGGGSSPSPAPPAPSPASSAASASEVEPSQAKKKKASSAAATRPSSAPAAPVDVDVVAEVLKPASSEPMEAKKKKAAGAAPGAGDAGPSSAAAAGAGRPTRGAALAEIKAQKMTVART